MARKLSIVVNNAAFSAHPGEILLDAALNQGIKIPHDCRAGQCGTCLIRVKQGELLGGETAQPNMYRACQARVFSDVRISYDRLPAVERTRGQLVAIERLAPDIRGLCIHTETPVRHRPGQYYRVKFRGYPARCFSATPPFVGSDDRKTLRFHIKLVPGGRVTPHFQAGIQPGHRVSLEGPFGSAFFRPGEGARLVLVASGTGFAPIWAVAKASLLRQPNVPLLLIVGSRRLSSLYAAPALCRLATYPAVDFIAATQDAGSFSEIIRPGTPAEHLPSLSATDLVYAAGSPKLVETVGQAAAQAQAVFYADPFVANGDREESWAGWLKEELSCWNVRSLRQRLFAIASPDRLYTRPQVSSDGVGAVNEDPDNQLRDERFWRNVA